VAPTIPTTEPTTLVIATTWKWNPSPVDFPAADGWALKYKLVGPTVLSFDATNTGTAFTVVVAHTATEIPAGTYSLLAYAELGGERHEVLRETVTVIDAGLTAKTGDDRRAWCERTLQAVEAVLFNKISGDVAEWSIAGKSVKSIAVMELWTMRAALRQELYTRRTGRRSQPMRVRFGRE
jgi:hypothetical protein